MQKFIDIQYRIECYQKICCLFSLQFIITYFLFQHHYLKMQRCLLSLFVLKYHYFWGHKNFLLKILRELWILLFVCGLKNTKNRKWTNAVWIQFKCSYSDKYANTKVLLWWLLWHCLFGKPYFGIRIIVRH